VAIRIEMPPDVTVTDVQTSSPQPPARGSNETQRAGNAARLEFSAEGNKISFKVPLEAYEMVVISTKPR
jgi:hypothetical protein